MDHYYNDTTMLTNKEIVDANIPLIKQCVECQFAAVKDEFTHQFSGDLMSDLIVTLYEYPNEKLNDVYSKGKGTLNALISAIITKSVWSKTSPFFRQYKKFGMLSDDLGKQIKIDDGENNMRGGVLSDDDD